VVLARHLHARPAGEVVRAATRAGAEVTLTVGERTVPARSVLAVMGLGALAGTTVTVTASGPAAATVADEIAATLTAPETEP
jgi:phosphotransferase system HPr (HPr) family protein